MTIRTLCAALAFAVAGFMVSPTITSADETLVATPQFPSLSEQVAQLQVDFAEGDYAENHLIDRIDSVVGQIDLKLDAGAENTDELVELRRIALDLRMQISGVANDNGTMLTKLTSGGTHHFSGFSGGGNCGQCSHGGGGHGGGHGGGGGGGGGLGSLILLGGVGGIIAGTSSSSGGSVVASPSSN